MSKVMQSSGMLAIVLSLTVGCSQSEPSSPNGAAVNAAYLLSEEPADARGVAEVRKSEGDEEVVTVEGRIGGSANPFVDGIAAFTIVDPAIPYCSADEGCPTPWDYCCEKDKLRDGTALVKIVGADGAPVSQDARDLIGVKELSKIVVRGKAQRDDEGNLTVLAEKVYIAQD